MGKPGENILFFYQNEYPFVLGLEGDLNIKIHFVPTPVHIEEKKVQTKILSSFKQRVTKFKDEGI